MMERLDYSARIQTGPYRYHYNTYILTYTNILKRIFNIIINIFFYSFTTSTERLRSSIETTELDLLLKEHNLGISYTSSYHAKRYAEIYVKVHGLVLDWSSVGKEVNFFSNKFYILLNIKKRIFFKKKYFSFFTESHLRNFVEK